MSIKQIKLVILLSISLTGKTQSWEQLSDYPGTERDDGVCFTLNNKTYCGTGFDYGFNVTGDFYAFDFFTEQWSLIASLPDSARRQYASSFVFNGEGYVFGGVNASGAYLNDLWKYTPVTDTWTNLFGLPDSGRSGALCFIIDGTAYIVGGKDEMNVAISEVWAYVISSNGWSQKSNAPTSIWRGIAYDDAGMGYIGLGMNNLSGLNPDFYRYFPQSDSWELVPELLAEPRTYPMYAKSGGQVFVYGGQTAMGYVNTFERINMGSLTIDNLTDFPSDARKGGSGFVYGSDFYLVNGVTLSERLNETWVARGALAINDIDQTETLDFGLSEGILSFYSDEAINTICIYSTNGQRVAESGSDGSTVIDVTQLSQGIYYFEIFRGSGISRGKLYLP